MTTENTTIITILKTQYDYVLSYMYLFKKKYMYSVETQTHDIVS